MPFTISDDFKAALEESCSLGKALLIVRSDGQVFAFTDAVRDVVLPSFTVGAITVPEQLYVAGECNFPVNLQQTDDPRQTDNWEFIVLLGDSVQASDVLKNLFLGATWTLIIYNRANTAHQMIRARGRVGESSLNGNSATLKMRGLSQLLSQEVLDVTSPLSRATWGDPELDFFSLGGNTHDGHAARVSSTIGTVDSTYPHRKFTVAATIGFPANRFTRGTVLWTSSANDGFTAGVLNWDNSTGTFTLDREPPFDIAAGDHVRCQIAPPLTVADFITYFGEARRFNGEPEIPTIEIASQVIQS